MLHRYLRQVNTSTIIYIYIYIHVYYIDTGNLSSGMKSPPLMDKRRSIVGDAVDFENHNKEDEKKQEEEDREIIVIDKEETKEEIPNNSLLFDNRQSSITHSISDGGGGGGEGRGRGRGGLLKRWSKSLDNVVKFTTK